jgi:hypothetical protein
VATSVDEVLLILEMFISFLTKQATLMGPMVLSLPLLQFKVLEDNKVYEICQAWVAWVRCCDGIIRLGNIDKIKLRFKMFLNMN